MDEARKRAYRYLIYYAMLDIRPLAWRKNLLEDHEEWNVVRYAGNLADCLHNLALYSTLDFVHFDEEWFWKDFRRLEEKYPQFGLSRYRDRFENELSASPK